jgi:class 3 adenylate cyclase
LEKNCSGFLWKGFEKLFLISWEEEGIIMSERHIGKSTTAMKRQPIAESGGWEGQIVILFADIVGCSEIYHYETLEKYNRILRQFKSLFKEVTNKYKNEFYSSPNNIDFKSQVRGNEGCLIIFRKAPEAVNPDLWADNIDTAIAIALDLKQRWLLSESNKERIGSGKHTSDIAVGIHFGQAWINKMGNNEYQPEGYAINLTKRIESHSREGAFTHIYLSEAAYDKLSPLTDKTPYTFDLPHLIKPKGISPGINVFEIKHHFLPTNWADETTKTAKWRTFEPSTDDIAKIEKAHLANPSNLWLLEECIMMQIQHGYKELLEQGKGKELRNLGNAYGESVSIARKLATSSMRDAVSLLVCMASYLGKIETIKKINSIMKKK